MKRMLIAATAAGAVIGILVWFFTSETHPHDQLGDGALQAIDKSNADAPHLERGPNVMG